MGSDRKNMHPRASLAFHNACVHANLRPVIVQTMGNAPQSAGTHGKDGTYEDQQGNKIAYSVCLDLSVRQSAQRLTDGAVIAMDDTHIKWTLHNLALQGFAAWYRRPEEGFDAKHIHAVYAGAPMKPICQRQVIDFINNRTGLVGHKTESYWTADPSTDAYIKALFEQYN